MGVLFSIVSEFSLPLLAKVRCRDFTVVCASSTLSLTIALDLRVLAQFPAGALVVNIARGPVIEYGTLLAAMQQGAGAEEPKPMRKYVKSSSSARDAKCRAQEFFCSLLGSFQLCYRSQSLRSIDAGLDLV